MPKKNIMNIILIWYNIYYIEFLNQKSDETAVCENNDGSFSCVCADGYERDPKWVEGKFYSENRFLKFKKIYPGLYEIWQKAFEGGRSHVNSNAFDLIIWQIRINGYFSFSLRKIHHMVCFNNMTNSKRSKNR